MLHKSATVACITPPRFQEGFIIPSSTRNSNNDAGAATSSDHVFNEEKSQDSSPISSTKRPPNLILNEDYYRRGSSGIIDTKGMKNRSRSVIIKLQVPKTTSPLVNRKSIGEGDNEPFRDRSITYTGGMPSKLSHSSPKLQRAISSRGKKSETLSPITRHPPPTNQEDNDDDDTLSDLNTMSGYHPLYSSRRNSFLYQMDNDDSPSGSSNNNNNSMTRSRTSSISSHIGEETYVTPYAQILAGLYRVRSQFISLTNPPISDERRRGRSWELPPIEHAVHNSEEDQALSLLTLDELDWCLHRLETINSGKSVGNLAQDKFKRLLSKELSSLSERSRSGHFVAEWVNTITGNTQDNEEIDKAIQSISTVETSQGLEATRTRSTSVTEQISRFGVSNVVNEEKLQKFLDQDLPRWEFDSFQLNYLTLEQPLVVCAYTVFTRRGLFTEFKISKQRFLAFMAAIESNYWKQNSYHNSIHAADVLHAVNYLLDSSALVNVFSPLEVLAVLIAAAVHDVDHPGRNNQFLINSDNDLAIMYNDQSVLEHHHLAVAFKILYDPSCNFLENLERTQMKALRKIIIDSVLATDMSKHFQHLGELKTMVETKKVSNDGILHVSKYSERSEILQSLLHCADLNNTAKPAHIASVWAHRIMEESFTQGDEEKKLKIDMNPLGDRDNVCVAKCQISFIDYIIFPLWETWAELVYPDAQPILEHLSQTREFWQQRNSQSPPLVDDIRDTPPPPVGKEGEEEEEEEGDEREEINLSSSGRLRRSIFRTAKVDRSSTLQDSSST